MTSWSPFQLLQFCDSVNSPNEQFFNPFHEEREKQKNMLKMLTYTWFLYIVSLHSFPPPLPPTSFSANPMVCCLTLNKEINALAQAK